MKKKIAFVGFWDSFDVNQNLIYKLLKKHYDIEICNMKNADYSICSLYNSDYINAIGVRIFYTAEAVAPDFTLFDYFIGFDDLDFGDRYVRIPNYIMNLKYEEDIKLMCDRSLVTNKERVKFCSWVCSNGNGDDARDHIFETLSKYKVVDSAGRYRNNIGTENGISNKRSFQEKYKFALAVENTSYRGYTTEKLIEAFAAGCIPIYWGDPDVGKVFNTKAFINLMDYHTIEEGLDYVKEVDQNDFLYTQMLSQNPLLNADHIEKSISDLECFLLNIFELPMDNAYRRPHGQTEKMIENIYRRGLQPKNYSETRLNKIIDVIFERRNK